MALHVVARRSVRRWVTPLAALALAVGPACAGDQDPGLAPQDPPQQTSDTLGRCPAGGPDATTPAAGCLGPDGQVLRP
jgi:hypothetical protein